MFNMFARKSQPAPVKTFTPPTQFEYNLHLILRLMASESNGDCTLRIKAEKGIVTMYVNGIRDLEGLARTYTPGAHRYFFQHPTYHDGSVRLTFREPDCYIFDCLQEGMEYDLREHAPNSYISAWYDRNGTKDIYIKFRRYPFDEETSRWNDFEALYRIWCK